MIDRLTGVVVDCEHEYIVIDVNGVGYQLFCSDVSPYMTCPKQSITLYTHHYVREDGMLLFGFQTREEQKLFRKLIEVSGIGPRVALGILRGATVDQMINAIYNENISFLMKLPGIGKKTAQRIIIDLKDKLKKWQHRSMNSVEEQSAPAFIQSDDTPWYEAREALQNLGYTSSELDDVGRRLQPHLNDEPSVDVLIKKALQLLYVPTK